MKGSDHCVGQETDLAIVVGTLGLPFLWEYFWWNYPNSLKMIVKLWVLLLQILCPPSLKKKKILVTHHNVLSMFFFFLTCTHTYAQAITSIAIS